MKHHEAIDVHQPKKGKYGKRKKKKKEKHKRKRKKKKKADSEYHGIRTLYAMRKALRESILKGQKVPLLNIFYTTAFLQFFIVICITTLVTLRRETEYFFRNTTETFNAIFKLSDDSQKNLLRTHTIIDSLEHKFDIFFNLTKHYSDHYIYPDDILIENATANVHHHHNLIPSAVLTFIFKDTYLEQSAISYELNPQNYSILSSKTSSLLISLIQHADDIHSYFQIESYSFVNDVRNSWRWYIDYHLIYTTNSNRMLPSIHLNYDKIDTSVSWWNKNSVPFMGSVIASFGLCAFSIMALTRFTYKYGFFFMFNTNTLRELQFRVILPISHLVALLCGLVYLINLSNILDLNDKSSLRLLIAVCAWLSWCMMLFTVQRQGTEYGALFKTLRISFKPIMILLVSLFPIAIGFILFGSLMFGVPDGNQMFTTPECTAKTLYAVWLGDEVHDTFLTAGVGHFVAELYMYTWGILFIAIIFNVGLAIVESNYFISVPQLDQGAHGFRHITGEEPLKGGDDEEEAAQAQPDRAASELSDSELFEPNIDREWALNRCDSYREDSPYIISSRQDPKVEAIPMRKIQTSIVRKTSSKMTKVNTTPVYDPIARSAALESKLDDDEIAQRNKKYAHLFASHLKHEILNKISQGLMDKNIAKLLQRFPIQTQRDADLLKDDIIKQYQLYLINVKKQLIQCVT